MIVSTSVSGTGRTFGASLLPEATSRHRVVELRRDLGDLKYPRTPVKVFKDSYVVLHLPFVILNVRAR